MDLIHLPEVDSTSSHLRLLAGQAAPWTVVLADRQTAGYGQRGRTWQSDAAGLYASILLGPEVVSPVFTLLAGLAALEGSQVVSGASDLGLKWVNDLVWTPAGQPGRKVGGLLTEVCHRKWLILGVGINLEPVAVPEAASLGEAAGRPVDRLELLEAIVGQLERGISRWQAGGNQAVVDAWAARSVTIGRRVAVDTAGEVVAGRAIGLDGDGHLLIELPDGRMRTIASGSVRLTDGSYC